MKMKKELMKRVAAAGLAVSMVAGLTACGPTGKPEETKKEETKAEGGETSAAADKEDAAASDGEVTLRFSWWGGDARHKATEAACQAFMEKYPNDMKVYYESEDFVCYSIPQNMYHQYNFAIDYGYNQVQTQEDEN